MTVLSNFLAELGNYPKDFVSLKVVDYTPLTGDSLNKHEYARFYVEVKNKGNLNMMNVGLRLLDTDFGDGYAIGTHVIHPTVVGQFPTPAAAMQAVPAAASEAVPVLPGRLPFWFKSSWSERRDIAAHSTQRFGPLYVEGKKVTENDQGVITEMVLTRVRVGDWDADLRHILTTHATGSSVPTANVVGVVYPPP